MTDPKTFLEEFLHIGLNHFTGVPDSTFKSFMNLLESKEKGFTNRIAANEGAAVAHASGYYLATNKLSVVYFQNSGLGNAVNPLTSLTDRNVYGIPMIILMGWRGQPGLKDEPQHKKMGAITIQMLEALGVSYEILNKNNFKEQIEKAKLFAEKKLEPFVLIVKPNFFIDALEVEKTASNDGVTRENAIECIVNKISLDSKILSTTGKTSRELYEICNKNLRGHHNNFYNVGSMGHVNAIGLEIAINNKNKVYILDGDGSIIMHMGSLATIGHYKPKNLIHIIFDNNSHESTGGQPTVSESLDIRLVLESCGYKKIAYVQTLLELEDALLLTKTELTGIVVQTKKGSRKDLGRPTDTPEKIKFRFMEKIIDESK